MKRSRPRHFATLGVLTVVALLVGSTILYGTEATSWWATAAGLVVAVVTLLPSLLTRSALQRTSTTEQLEHGLDRFVLDSLGRLESELELHGLKDSSPIRIGWSLSTNLPVNKSAAVFIPVGDSGRPDRRRRLMERGDVTELSAAYRRVPSRRLVLLGGPGAGKSASTLLLVVELLRTRNPSEPVPVLLPIASWRPSIEPFRSWAADRIRENYPALTDAASYGPTVVEDLIGSRRLFYVLDGVDEIDEGELPVVVGCLNRAIPPGHPIIITCRTDIYHICADGDEAIRGAAVLDIQPIEPDVVADFLRAATLAGANPWGEGTIRIASERSSAIAQAISTPLMASMARLASVSTLMELNSRDERAEIEDLLLDAYLERAAIALADEFALHQPSRVQHWLRFLARELAGDSRPEIRWWQLSRHIPFRLLLAGGYVLLCAILYGSVLMNLLTPVRLSSTGMAIGSVSAAVLTLMWISSIPLAPSMVIPAIGNRGKGFRRVLFAQAASGFRIAFVLSVGAAILYLTIVSYGARTTASSGPNAT